MSASNDPSARYRHLVTRRAILRGVGATLALPFLPSFTTSSYASVQAGTERAPRRFVAAVFSNGVNCDHWWQKTDASHRITEVGKTLKPLEAHLDDCLFLNDLHLFDKSSGIHNPFFTNFLTGLEVSPGAVPKLDQSVDQYMASTVGNVTPVPSISLGIEPAGFGLAGGKPAIYNSTISWSSKTTPIPPEVFPRQAFDRLFDTSSLLRDKSILDYLLVEAKGVRRGLVPHDKEQLDRYLDSIREIEKRIEIATSEGRLEGWQPSLAEPNLERPNEGTPQNLPEHMRLMLDLIVLALQMDKTRVATLIFQRDTSNMRFDFLDGVGKGGLHGMSHHRSDEETLRQYQLTNEFHVRQLAYLMEKMRQIDEGDGTTLLDNTAILFGSTMADGNSHDSDRLRLVVAGGKSLGIRGGRSLHYEKMEDRRLCNLHVDLAQRMGCDIDAFGNSHYPLPGISG